MGPFRVWWAWIKVFSLGQIIYLVAKLGLDPTLIKWTKIQVNIQHKGTRLWANTEQTDQGDWQP